MISKMASLVGFVFIDPIFLVLVFLLPVFVLVRRRLPGPVLIFSPSRFLPVNSFVIATWRRRLIFLPRALMGIGISLLILALARPASPLAMIDQKSGIDLLLCVDASSSMDTLDMKKENRRLDVASSAAVKFLKGRPHDQVGLVRFARYPDLVCPLTFDHDALGEKLKGLKLVGPGGPEDATGIGTALTKCVEVLQRNEGDSKVIVLLTDGAENVSSAASPNEIAPIHSAQLCKELGIRVYIVLAGNGSLQNDGTWRTADTSQVELVARRTGGRFFAAQDQASLQRVFSQIDELEQKEIGETQYRMKDGFVSFLVAGLAIFFLGRFLSGTLLEVKP